MRMIPDVVTTGTKSDAERRVFRLLEQTGFGANAIAYHSLNLSKHEYKRVGEIDFLIVSNQGVFVLEVKGGEIARHSGIWIYRNRYGDESRSSEGPFKQAQSAMFALEERLQDEVEHWADVAVFGFGVVTPDCELNVHSVEWDLAIVLDASEMHGHRTISVYLDRLASFWAARSPRREPQLPGDGVAALTRPIRPDFERLVSLRVRAGQIDTAMEELTRDQYAALDLLTTDSRIVFEGGAGTGKSFLAAEYARRHAALGQRVAFVCSNPIFIRFVKGRLAGQQIDVGEARDLYGSYDVLVVDEAQDFINYDDLVLLDDLVDGGLANGCWRMFLDPNRQRDLVGRYDPDARKEIDSHRPAVATLVHNCRNTEPIARQTRLYTGADLGNPMAGAGLPVAFRYVEPPETPGCIDAIVDELEEEIPGGWITVLGVSDFPHASASRTRLAADAALRPLAADLAFDWPPSVVTYSSAAEFKGMENAFVVLSDLDRLDLSSQHAINTLYVAMSRARIGLHVVASRAVKKWMQRLGASHLGDR